MPLDGGQSENRLFDAEDVSPEILRRRECLRTLVRHFVEEAVAATPPGRDCLYRGPEVRRTKAGSAILAGNDKEREACLVLAFSWLSRHWSEVEDEDDPSDPRSAAAIDCLFHLFVTLHEGLSRLSGPALALLIEIHRAQPPSGPHFDQHLDDVLDLVERAAIEEGLPSYLNGPLSALKVSVEQAFPKPGDSERAYGERIDLLLEDVRRGQTIKAPTRKVRSLLTSFLKQAGNLNLGVSRRAKAKALPAGARILALPADERRAFLLPALRHLAVHCGAEGQLFLFSPYDETLNHLSALATALLRAKLPLEESDAIACVELAARAWRRMPTASVVGLAERFVDQGTPSRALIQGIEGLRCCIAASESLDANERALLRRVEGLLNKNLHLRDKEGED